jgi:hypothetical protein
MDSKNNYQVGWTNDQEVSHRFRASTTSTLVSVAVNQRGGPGYSGGNGGSMRVTVQTDNGGKPSGTVLASLTITPGNPAGHWENQNAYAFASPPSLTKGQLYHIVFTNNSSSPTTNYISLNEAYTFIASVPRQPAFSDDFAVLYERGSGWQVLPSDTPVMDLTYADGRHDGNAYFGLIVDYYGLISGVQQVRERFTVSGHDRTISTATIRVKRISGEGPLTLRLERADGSVLASGTAGSGLVPISPLPEAVDENDWDEGSLAGGRWVTVSFGAPIVLRTGRTYTLRVTADESSRYATIPLREQDATNPRWRSRAFRDGSAQRTSNGAAWRPIYAFGPADLQFYLR